MIFSDKNFRKIKFKVHDWQITLEINDKWTILLIYYLFPIELFNCFKLFQAISWIPTYEWGKTQKKYFKPLKTFWNCEKAVGKPFRHPVELILKWLSQHICEACWQMIPSAKDIPGPSTKN